MKRFLTLVRMNARMVFRNRQSVGWILLFPVMMMLFWGYIGRKGTAQATFNSAATVAYAGFMMGGMVVLTALQQGIMGHTQGMVLLREQGILRRVRCTPLPTWMFLLSRLVVEVALSLAGCLLVIAVAVGLYGVRLSWQTVPAAFILLLLAIALFIAFGQVIAAVARRQETARAIAQAISFPLMFIGGIFLQPEFFPAPLATVAQWTPAAVVADLLRPALLQGSFGARPLLNLMALLGYLAVALVLSARFFRWDAGIVNPDQRFMVRLQWVWFAIVAILTGAATAATFADGAEAIAAPRGAAIALLAVLYLVWDWQWRFARIRLLHEGLRWGLLAWGGNLALCLALVSLSQAYSLLFWVLAGESVFFLHMPLGPFGMLATLVVLALSGGSGPRWQMPHTSAEWGSFLGAVIAIVSWMTIGVMLERLFRIHARNEQLIRDLRASREQIQRAAAQERELALLRERERLARDLHDTVGYALVLASVKLEAAARLERVDQERATAELEATKQVLRQTMGELRRTVASLRATPGDEQSLAVTIAGQAREVADQAGLRARVSCEEVAGLSPAREEALRRVAQEALTNVVKHAAATEVSVTLGRQGGAVVLEIADNGRGMPPAGPAGEGHFGIRGMHERLELVGGRLAVTGAPGGGTRVRAEVAPGGIAAPELREVAAHGREDATPVLETP